MFDLAGVWRKALHRDCIPLVPPEPVAQPIIVAPAPVAAAPVAKPPLRKRPPPALVTHDDLLERVAAAIGKARRPHRGYMPSDRDLAIAAVNALANHSDAVIAAMASEPVAPALRLAGLAIHGNAEQRARLKAQVRWRAAIRAILKVTYK